MNTWIIIIETILQKVFFWGGERAQESAEKFNKNIHDTSVTAEPKGTASALHFKCFFQHSGVPREELRDLTEELSLLTVH